MMTETNTPVRDEDSEDIGIFLRPLKVDEEVLYCLAHSFSTVYQQLAQTQDDSLFCPTPVTYLPTGLENGRYLAVDVGTTTLRIAFIELLGDSAEDDLLPEGDNDRSNTVIRKAQLPRVRRTLEKAWRIEEHLQQDQAHELFLWIGNCIAEVVKDDLAAGLGGRNCPNYIETGITFSLPIKQKSLAEAILMQTGKGFTIGSDLDLRKSLLDGYERHTRRTDDDGQFAKRQKIYSLPKLEIVTLTNDSVATLLSLAYSIKSLPNSRVTMGIVIGPGCNATIPMKLKGLHRSKADQILSYDSKAEESLVSTEWTLQGASVPVKEHKITTKWDEQLDAHCARPGFQPLEYMTGGRYIGELVRIICFDYFHRVMKVPKTSLPSILINEYSLTTTFLTDIVASASSDEILANRLTRECKPPTGDWTWIPKTAQVLRSVAFAVQTRSAALIAAQTVGLLSCNQEISLKEPAASAVSTTFDGETRENTFDSMSDWQGGPEELVVAYVGAIIQHYPKFKETCQRYIDRLVIKGGPQEGGKSVFLREANDGAIIGAGVLAGMVVHSKAS